MNDYFSLLLFLTDNDFWTTDVTQGHDSGPPPYQAPPSYYNSSAFAQDALEIDPFDTSNVCTTTTKQPYSVAQISPTILTSTSTATDLSVANLLPSSFVNEPSKKNNTTNLSKFNGSLNYHNNYVQSDISNRGMNYVKSTGFEKDTNVAVSKSVSVVQKDIALPLLTKATKESENDLLSSMSALKFDESSSKKTSTPSHPKTVKKNNEKASATCLKIQNGDACAYAKTNDMAEKNDTTTVLNKMWFDTNVNSENLKHNNKNVQADTECSLRRNDTYVVNSEFGQFKSNRRYDPVYSSTSLAYESTSYYDAASNCNNSSGIGSNTYNNTSLYNTQTIYNDIAQTPIPTNTLYNSTGTYSNQYTSSNRDSVNSYTSYSTQKAAYGYGTLPERQYSEVAEDLYQEIPDNFYSQVPDETLRPHRPAPTKPGIQPLSMQQIQRKLQQGQLTADAERLMTPEYRSNKVSQVRDCISDVDKDECLTVLQSCGWDVAAAIKTIKIEKLFKLGLADKSQCEMALQRSNWNVELAASAILDT
ncbi:hypothetical protein NQ314_014434 [Rhamnusium bicolor]|uniref:UBA domain-containing protein n=1 Tax=Rhamnusium bicolor TaxID=1586634 RepID=A0AAV8X2E7_9CUCU|nr:hypothetical protein NQ314_014434 [Rhamnusium bicolor]